MKTSKRKRSAKAASVTEASGVDLITADAPVVAEAAAELSPDAVEALVAETDVSSETVIEATVADEETVVAAALATETAEPIVVLAANCSVKDAAALKASLSAFSNNGDAVTLDVSAVERVDTATMQLLCAFVRDRSGRNQSVSWRGESQALQDAVRLLGVGALMGFETKGVAA